MKDWQFNVLFFVGVGGAILLLLGPSVGLEIDQNPTALTGVGAILTYILTQRSVITKHEKDTKSKDAKPKATKPKESVGEEE